MTATSKPSTGELFIVDNSNSEWKVKNYLQEWTDLAHSFDVATGYFEIGALLALEGNWQKLEHLRILMGDEVTKRTRNTLLTGAKSVLETGLEKLDSSIEQEKEGNNFLHGVLAIVDALRNAKISVKVYNKGKFHAKAYITHSKYQVMGSAALVGSSNFTLPGLTENIELNLQIRREVEELQAWYEHYWELAEDVTPEILKTIERHTAEYLPFLLYAKALQEYFRGHEITAGEWEQNQSRIYPILDQYQKEGYQALVKIGRTYNGALLCDGVGLGKTFIGMMLLERLIVHERKRVVLLVPLSARKPVWEKALRRYLPNIPLTGDFSNLVILNHTDLNREGDMPARLENIREMADVFLIDEAHHFRNPGIKGEGTKKPSRYRRLYDVIGDKAVYMLTATPVNNRLIDLQHMMELFTRQRSDYFKPAPLGIHSLPGHFRKMEKQLDALVKPKGEEDEETETNEVEAEQVLQDDALFRTLVVQRSRAYVKASQIQNGATAATFPVREDPKVATYSIKRTYGRLLTMIEKAFDKEKPLFSLAVYYPLAYYLGEDKKIDPLAENRQKQVVGLVRTMFLKRFESSAKAFEMSCEVLMLKLLAWVTKHSQTASEIKRLERWKDQHAELVGWVQQMQMEFGEGTESGEDAEDDIISEEMLESVEELSRESYNVAEILAETYLDLDQVADFLDELRKFRPSNDDKLQALIKLLKSDPALKKHKVIIFSEFSDTARYLKAELIKAGIQGVDEVDSGVKRDRGDIIRQFAPYYNESSSAELKLHGLSETRVLVSTDVLSEGLNLQDATRLINYDLHWNPVRLMQRIGRVDRRMNPDTEKKLLADHPDQKEIRGTAAYWNFLPPDELDDLLRLYGKVSHKTLKISKTFGIEGRKLLKPEDEYESIKDFNHAYEGTTTLLEKMHLEYQQLLKDYPPLAAQLANLPGRVFSGKAHPTPGCRAVFFCYALPAPVALPGGVDAKDAHWTEEAGFTKWFLYDLDTGQITDEPTAIVDIIRCQPNTPRLHLVDDAELSDIRGKLDKHIKNTYMKSVQAPQGVKATLKVWLEIA